MVDDDALSKRIRQIIKEEKGKAPEVEAVKLEVETAKVPKEKPPKPEECRCGSCGATYEKEVEVCEECGAKLKWS